MFSFTLLTYNFAANFMIAFNELMKTPIEQPETSLPTNFRKVFKNWKNVLKNLRQSQIFQD